MSEKEFQRQVKEADATSKIQKELRLLASLKMIQIYNGCKKEAGDE